MVVDERLPTTGQSPRELKRQLELERDGRPFLIHRDEQGDQQLTVLSTADRVLIGRSEDADVSLSFDGEVSRLHAVIEHAGGEWILIDDGLSSNGSYVNERRIAGRRRLQSGDVIRLRRHASRVP